MRRAFRVECDGKLMNPVSQLTADDCSEVIIYLTTATSNRYADPRTEVIKVLDAAQKKGYQSLKEEHIRDFSALMEKCQLDLGKTGAGKFGAEALCTAGWKGRPGAGGTVFPVWPLSDCIRKQTG